MNDDQLLLASAYLDDDVDVAARARAEADPEVMAEIARLRAMRVALRTVGEPDAARRERAIGAALAAFDEEPSVPTATTAVVPLPHRARRGWWGALAAAAAVVVVAAGAIALRSGGGARDGDDSAAFATAALEDAQQSATAAAPAPQAGDSESAPERAPAATADDAAAAGSAAEVAALPVLTTPAQLVAFADAAAAGAVDAPRAASDAATCSHPGTFVGTASYGDVVVEVFDDGALVSAVDATTCDVVEEVER